MNILEIEVSQGGSLELWKKYFGKKMHLYGVDINPGCKELEEEQVTIFIGEAFRNKRKLDVTNFTKSVYALHFYTGMY